MRLSLGANSGGLTTSGFGIIRVFLVVIADSVEASLSGLKKRNSGSTRIRTGSLKGPTPWKYQASLQSIKLAPYLKVHCVSVASGCYSVHLTQRPTKQSREPETGKVTNTTQV